MKHKTLKRDTLCWDCEKQCGKCSWSKEFKPVNGWKAIPTKIMGGVGKYERCIESFLVIECPEFELLKRLEKRTVPKRSIIEGVNYKCLKESGVSQGQLAKASGVSNATVSRFVRGTRKFKYETLKKIADALGCSVDEFEIGGVKE